MPKRSEVIKKIASILDKENSACDWEYTAESILGLIETVMEPKIRPLSDKEVEEHVLVKQVHHSRKDEVRNYVKNLDYEWKRSWLSEDE